jgi:Methyltransferase domain
MPLTDEIWQDIEAQPGWCWREKADLIMRVASRPEVMQAVEIGVFGGRSLLPLCLAVCRRGGVVWGFDIYQPHKMTTKADEEFWRDLPYSKIQTDARALLRRYGFSEFVIVAESSAQASKRFENDTIQYVHIDGSHRTWDAVEDIILWTRRLTPGGFLLIDDTDWPQLQLALELLRNSDLVHDETISNKGRGEGRGESQLWRKRS